VAATQNAVKRPLIPLSSRPPETDRDRRPGRFLLTGSVNLLLLPRLGDSRAGRMEVVELPPLTAAEQARKPGRFLQALLEGRLKPSPITADGPGLAQLAARVTAGGFPEAVARPPARAREWHRQYLRIKRGLAGTALSGHGRIQRLAGGQRARPGIRLGHSTNCL